MRIFQFSHATKVLVALCLMALSFAGWAEARDGDRPRYERRYIRRDWRRHDRHDGRRIARDHRRHDRHERRDRRRDRDYFPSDIQGDTYFGGLSAWRDGRNGIYFRSERYGYDSYGGGYEEHRGRRRGRIIYVNPSRPDRACSYEAGVCVIRR